MSRLKKYTRESKSCLPSQTKTSPYTTKKIVAFWSINIMVLVLALIIRFAPPAAIISPVQAIRPITIIPSNVCVTVNQRILDISRTSADNEHEITAKINSLHAYVKKTADSVPAIRDDTITPEFLNNVHDLLDTLDRWEADKRPSKNSIIKPQLLMFRGRLHATLRSLPRRHAAWYLSIARFSTGYLEGFSSVLLLPYRAVSSYMTGRLSAANILSPPNWRRTGTSFYLAMFYSALLNMYLFALLAQKLHRNILYAPGLISLIYGTGHFIVFLYLCSKSVPEVIERISELVF